MKDKALLEKIIAKQNKIFTMMDGDTVDVPSKLYHAEEAAKQWAAIIEKEEGRDKEARPKPVKELAKELHEHIDIFDRSTREDVREYCDLVGRLPYDADETLGV
ncbi:hypothetical protein [Anaerotardibacter muris]|uniref:hypothetical protein n=1 Tax=Anaerotardibacter muris TaxID=2941505 RepID=UPI00203EFC3D|nr:hypothetical protein [Anaerotardibacter muris]